MTTTGFEALDDLVEISPGDMICIASRPSMGKSSLMKDIASHCVGDGVVFWVDLQRSEKNFEKLFIAQLSNPDIRYIGPEESESLKLFDKIMRSLSKAENTYLFIDNIELFYQEEVYEKLHDLKKFAVKKNIIVFFTTKISPEVEKRPGHRPRLEDIGEGQQNLSDKIFFLLRRDYYDANDKPGMAELIVAKNSDGNTGNLNLTFAKEDRTFYNYAPVEYMYKADTSQGSHLPNFEMN